MTRNQIEYLKLKEQQRANQMTVLENRRHATASEVEAKRSNVARERETSRANQASEYRSILNLNELKRSNIARETETNRHNVSTEALTREQNIETSRHNQATEFETSRSNRVQEALSSQRNSLNAAQIAESTRHNMVSENLTQAGQYYNYSLGLGGLDVQQQNADTASRNASTNRMEIDALMRNAATNEQNANTRVLEYLNSAQRTQIEQYLADETNRHNLATEFAAQERISLDRAELIVDSVLEGLSMLKNSGKSAKDVSYMIWRMTHGKQY